MKNFNKIVFFQVILLLSIAFTLIAKDQNNNNKSDEDIKTEQEVTLKGCCKEEKSCHGEALLKECTKICEDKECQTKCIKIIKSCQENGEIEECLAKIEEMCKDKDSKMKCIKIIKSCQDKEDHKE
jgi:hypothetical protein